MKRLLTTVTKLALLVLTAQACNKSAEPYYSDKNVPAVPVINKNIIITPTGVAMYPAVEKTLRAKQPMESLLFDGTVLDGTLSTTTPSILPSGSQFDLTTNLLKWRSDLQDIGKSIEGQVGLNKSSAEYLAGFKFTVLAPEVSKVSCSSPPEMVIGAVEPVKKWQWEGFADYKLTFSSPVAGDLDGNGEVEIVTMISTGNYYETNGPIVVLKGATGEVLWNSMTESGITGEVSTTPVLLDLNNDGKSEIISVAKDGGARKINIIDYQRRAITASYSESFDCGSYCIPAAADIDGDGNAEIVAGNVVLNRDGSRKFFLTPAPEYSNRAQTVTLADLVPESPGLEIISNGSQVYSSTGNLLWKGVCRGFSAVADLAKDNSPELVCTYNGWIYAYSKDGQVQWTKAVTGGGKGGAPNIGHFTGDNFFQIGVAGGSNYVVLDKDGNTLWEKAVQDYTSSSTGSTVFDFNGDGKVEVIYNDELYLRIFDGLTGNILWSAPNISGTLWEYPLIVDVDNDSSADIVVAAPGWHTTAVASPGQGGIKVFTDPTKKWVSTRKIWNQYSYYPEIVSDTLAAVANPGPLKSGFRINTQGSLIAQSRVLQADLGLISPLYPEVTGVGQKLSFYVLNQGEATSKANKTIKVYLEGSDVVVGSVTIADEIQSGAGLLVSIDLPDPLPVLSLRAELNLESDSSLSSRECNADNNKLSFDLLSLSR
ncbi:MAG TPA: PQQ-binding-like beta-propeller repeat protein [Bacteriovoracaceae bacterium]|nr:PQQ-binding-like beta-propeller repeat protein [Bacteriovoracaceae bacterium]